MDVSRRHPHLLRLDPYCSGVPWGTQVSLTIALAGTDNLGTKYDQFMASDPRWFG